MFPFYTSTKRNPIVVTASIVNILTDIINTTSVVVCLLWRTNEIHYIGAPIFATVVLEVSKPGIESMSEKLNRVKVDSKEIVVLGEVIQNKVALVETSQLLNERVRSAFEKEAIEFTRLFHLVIQEHQMVYLSISTSSENELVLPEHHNIINGGVAKIRKLI